MDLWCHVELCSLISSKQTLIRNQKIKPNQNEIPEAFTNTYKIHRDEIAAQPKNSPPQATAICRADRCNGGKWKSGKEQRISTDTVRVEGGKV